MKHVPFPANVVLAPVVAATTFAGAMSFATFDQGGIVPKTQMALVHGGERVLTREQTSRFEHVLESTPGHGGGDKHTHYHAAPGDSPDSVRRNVGELQRWLRDGRLRLA